MKTRNMTTTKLVARMAAIMLLAVGFMASSAIAQDKDRPTFRPIGYYVGVEASEGTLEAASGNTYGNTIVLNSFGEWDTNSLTVSLNYSTNQFVPENFIVTGGTWSMVVTQNNVYAGTIYGKVMAGNVQLSTNNNGDSIQITQIMLQATGGLGVFEGKEIKGRSGSFDVTTDLRSRQSEGNVQFNE